MNSVFKVFFFLKTNYWEEDESQVIGNLSVVIKVPPAVFMVKCSVKNMVKVKYLTLRVVSARGVTSIFIFNILILVKMIVS